MAFRKLLYLATAPPAISAGALSCLLVVLVAPPASGAGITAAGGQPEVVHYQADGATEIPVDSGFHFELGTFVGNFTPTAGNTADWLANWQPLTDSGGAPLPGATVEFTTIPFVFGPYPGWNIQAELDHANPPFTPGTQAYVWGFDNRSTSGTGQWILLTDSADWR